MTKRFLHRIFLLLTLLTVGALTPAMAQEVKTLLVMGDSMSGWMGERLNAYGQTNGFDVATIVWDGSTIKKWGAEADRAKSLVDEIDPDAVIICLGLNECAERNPESQLGKPLAEIIEAVGDRPLLWVGPPSWPGKDYGEPFNSWLAGKLGEKRFFLSKDIDMPRQSATNPHPTREGINEWTDAIVEWIPNNATFKLPGYNAPDVAPSRGKTFIYRKMKESL